ncbi:MAG: hypothetical protein AB7Y46_17445, partial [Armatimonadota bacterium]
PEARGYCQPGRPWSPLALPWLATGFAALMPLATGATALWAASALLGVPEEPAELTLSTDWRHLGAILSGLDYHSWRTWTFLYLAISIGSELAPSDIDLRKSVPALLVGAMGAALLILGVSQLPAGHALRRQFDIYAGWALSWASTVLDFGIMALVLVGLPAALLAFPLRPRR